MASSGKWCKTFPPHEARFLLLGTGAHTRRPVPQVCVCELSNRQPVWEWFQITAEAEPADSVLSTSIHSLRGFGISMPNQDLVHGSLGNLSRLVPELQTDHHGGRLDLRDQRQTGESGYCTQE